MKQIIFVILGIILGALLTKLDDILPLITGNKKSKEKIFFNPWHDLDPGKDAPNIVEAYIEVPKGSQTKYEIDKKYGIIRVDRVLPKEYKCPANYGFIPQTYYFDGDPLDILVISDSEFAPGSVVTARVIGILKMNDQGAQDDKVLAVAVGEKRYENVQDVEELPIKEIKEYFLNYKKSEGKEVKLGELLRKDLALGLINQSFVLYNEKFS